MTDVRSETDTFGPIDVAADRYWGAQAQRSLGNFKIGWEKQPLPIVRALGIVKRAAAETNMALGRLDPTIGAAIIKAELTHLRQHVRSAGPDADRTHPAARDAETQLYRFGLQLDWWLSR